MCIFYVLFNSILNFFCVYNLDSLLLALQKVLLYLYEYLVHNIICCCLFCEAKSDFFLLISSCAHFVLFLFCYFFFIFFFKLIAGFKIGHSWFDADGLKFSHRRMATHRKREMVKASTPTAIQTAVTGQPKNLERVDQWNRLERFFFFSFWTICSFVYSFRKPGIQPQAMRIEAFGWGGSFGCGNCLYLIFFNLNGTISMHIKIIELPKNMNNI